MLVLSGAVLVLYRQQIWKFLKGLNKNDKLEQSQINEFMNTIEQFKGQVAFLKVIGTHPLLEGLGLEGKVKWTCSMN